MQLIEFRPYGYQGRTLSKKCGISKLNAAITPMKMALTGRKTIIGTGLTEI